MFEATTSDIRIEVEPTFIEAQSNPQQSYYFFSYRIRIRNGGSKRIQLISRHWIITDGFGQVEEVTGPGVIGQQPTLKPGDTFEYSSFCPLSTPTGSMQGKYLMVTEKGDQLEVQIPLFVLSEPRYYH
jgi:ApaG protein